MILILQSFLGRSPSFTSLNFSSSVLSCSFIEAYSSVPLFFLICCFYFYVPCRLVIFPDLGGMTFYRRSPMCPISTLSSGAPMWGEWACLSLWSDYYGFSGGLDRLLFSYLPGSSLCRGWWPVFGRTEPQGEWKLRVPRDRTGSPAGKAGFWGG